MVCFTLSPEIVLNITSLESSVAARAKPVCFQNSHPAPPPDGIGVYIQQTSDISGAHQWINAGGLLFSGNLSMDDLPYPLSTYA